MASLSDFKVNIPVAGEPRGDSPPPSDDYAVVEKPVKKAPPIKQKRKFLFYLLLSTLEPQLKRSLTCVCRNWFPLGANILNMLRKQVVSFIFEEGRFLFVLELDVPQSSKYPLYRLPSVHRTQFKVIHSETRTFVNLILSYPEFGK